VRESCLDYFREIDRFLAEIMALAGQNVPIVIASDHGFGPTVEVFHLNAWLHQHGYLSWANAANVEQKHSETLGMGTMARRFYEIDWDRTTAYCPTPSSNGIYITPPAAGGQGVPAAQYESFRRELIEKLLQFKDPENGQPVITRIWTREEAFSGERMSSAPDLTLSLRDGGLVSILPSDVILKPRKETSGAHRPNGVFVAAGKGIRRGISIPALSILDVAPVLLYSLGLPIPRDYEGRVPQALFKRDYLASHPVEYESPVQRVAAVAAQPAPDDSQMEAELIGQLRALGYME
jgi:predicted AlkP superfamily phosphohydrolase/phosphomutase